MCRRDQIHGLALLAFGAGLLLGCWIGSMFWRICLGICAVGGGCLILLKK